MMEFPENHIKFDFLGKDSIRYENEVEVDPIVWKLVKKFCASNQNGKGTIIFCVTPLKFEIKNYILSTSPNFCVQIHLIIASLIAQPSKISRGTHQSRVLPYFSQDFHVSIRTSERR